MCTSEIGTWHSMKLGLFVIFFGEIGTPCSFHEAPNVVRHLPFLEGGGVKRSNFEIYRSVFLLGESDGFEVETCIWTCVIILSKVAMIPKRTFGRYLLPKQFLPVSVFLPYFCWYSCFTFANFCSKPLSAQPGSRVARQCLQSPSKQCHLHHTRLILGIKIAAILLRVKIFLIASAPTSPREGLWQHQCQKSESKEFHQHRSEHSCLPRPPPDHTSAGYSCFTSANFCSKGCWAAAKVKKETYSEEE